MPYHCDGSGDTALQYLTNGFDVPTQPQRIRNHFPKLVKKLCEKNPRLAQIANCNGCLPLHGVGDAESARILLDAYPEGVMARSIFGGQIPLHVKSGYFIDVREDAFLPDGGFLAKDESPPIVRLLVEEGLNQTWSIPVKPTEPLTSDSPMITVPGWSAKALGGIMVKDRRGDSPFGRICKGINNKLTTDGRVAKIQHDTILHILWAKLRIFAEANYAASVYLDHRRGQQRQQQVSRRGKRGEEDEGEDEDEDEEDALIPHKRIILRDVGSHPSDPPFVFLHELLRLRVPPRLIMFCIRNDLTECTEVGRYGRRAVHLAAEGGYDYQTILKPILDADPDAVDLADPLTGFHPFMLAAFRDTGVVNLTSAFRLLVSSPVSARGLAGPMERPGTGAGGASAASAASAADSDNRSVSSDEVRELREAVRSLREVVETQGRRIAQLEAAAAASAAINAAAPNAQVGETAVPNDVASYAESIEVSLGSSGDSAME